MKWCCSPYTTGVTIGSFYIVGSVLFFIFELILYLQYEEKVDYPEHTARLKSDAIKAMISCGVSIVISCLFIVGIVKRRHYLILPWLLYAIFVFYATASFMYIWFIGGLMGGAPGVVFIILILIAIIGAATQIAIFYLSFSLFKKIRIESIEKSERVEQQKYNKNLI